MQKGSRGLGPTAADNTRPKKSHQLLTAMQIAESRKLFTVIASRFAKYPIVMGSLFRLLALREKKKIVLSSLSHAGLAQKVISGDATGTSATVLMFFQEAGTRRPTWLLSFSEQVGNMICALVKGKKNVLKT